MRNHGMIPLVQEYMLLFDTVWTAEQRRNWRRYKFYVYMAPASDRVAVLGPTGHNMSSCQLSLTMRMYADMCRRACAFEQHQNGQCESDDCSWCGPVAAESDARIMHIFHAEKERAQRGLQALEQQVRKSEAPAERRGDGRGGQGARAGEAVGKGAGRRGGGSWATTSRRSAP